MNVNKRAQLNRSLSVIAWKNTFSLSLSSSALCTSGHALLATFRVFLYVVVLLFCVGFIVEPLVTLLLLRLVGCSLLCLGL